MAPVAAHTRDISRLSVDTSLEEIPGEARPQCVLLHEFNVRVAAVTGFRDIGRMGHRLQILTRQDIMPSVTIVTIGGPLGPLHDHF